MNDLDRARTFVDNIEKRKSTSIKSLLIAIAIVISLVSLSVVASLSLIPRNEDNMLETNLFSPTIPYALNLTEENESLEDNEITIEHTSILEINETEEQEEFEEPETPPEPEPEIPEIPDEPESPDEPPDEPVAGADDEKFKNLIINNKSTLDLYVATIHELKLLEQYINCSRRADSKRIFMHDLAYYIEQTDFNLSEKYAEIEFKFLSYLKILDNHAYFICKLMDALRNPDDPEEYGNISDWEEKMNNAWMKAESIWDGLLVMFD